jgi:DNA phosphorothioation-dependent restriction protein DptG
MMKVELLREGAKGLEDVYLKNGIWKRKHPTGNTIKLMPFVTTALKESSYDFHSFQGIVGECFRISNNKAFNKAFATDKESSFKKKLRNHILSEVIAKVDSDNNEEFKDIVINLFFEEDGGLIKFNKQVLPYMNFINDHPQLNETARFFCDLFLDAETLNEKKLISSRNDNLFYQLIVDCLPELNNKETSKNSKQYLNLFKEIKVQFLEDFKFLASNEETFLKHIEDLFKYYYFFYLTQLAQRFNSFGHSEGTNPIYFSMDWETLSESRLSYQYGWKKLSNDLKGLFSHANTIELLNYITINGDSIGDYLTIKQKWPELSTNEQKQLIEKIKEISKFYTDHIDGLDTGESWEKCEKEIKSFLNRNTKEFKDELSIELVSFYKRVSYQFDNSVRKSPKDKYEKWLTSFSIKNFTKTRGRLGLTTVINQEHLLFQTKLCVGNEEKIRLNELWERLNKRGLTFDETSKAEIIKLFERINLLEKKSDSGDAQYVKSVI